jgi:hypothetical protein
MGIPKKILTALLTGLVFSTPFTARADSGTDTSVPGGGLCAANAFASLGNLIWSGYLVHLAQPEQGLSNSMSFTDNWEACNVH